MVGRILSVAQFSQVILSPLIIFPPPLVNMCFSFSAIAGLAAACGYGAYSYKRRGAMSTSVFLMQFRVIAQGTAVGALTAGMAYHIYTTYINKPATAAIPAIPAKNEH